MDHIIQFLIGNYGALGILVLAIGGLAFLIIKELRKSNKALMDKQIEMSNSTTTAIVSSLSSLSETLTNDLRQQNKDLLDHLLKRGEDAAKAHNENLISRRNVTLEINNLINDLRIGLDAQRVTIIEFHNSFANQTGFPFLKFTVTYEKFCKGSTPLQNLYQGMQFSSIAEICELVLQSDTHMCFLKSADEIDDIVPIMMLHKREVNSAIFKGLFNIEDNMLIGLMCIEFRNDIPVDYDELSIISSARTISELITLSKS